MDEKIMAAFKIIEKKEFINVEILMRKLHIGVLRANNILRDLEQIQIIEKDLPNYPFFKLRESFQCHLCDQEKPIHDFSGITLNREPFCESCSDHHFS